MDDKITITCCVTIIVLFAMFMLEDASNVINAALTGLFGLAVGKNLK